MASHRASIHASGGGGRKLGAVLPNQHEEWAFSDSAELPAGQVRLRFAVTAVGNVVLVDGAGNEVTYHFPAVGVYYEDGQFAKVKLTGATATFSPAAKCIAQRLEGT